MSHSEQEAHVDPEATREAEENAKQEARIQQSIRGWTRATMGLGFALAASIASVIPFLYGQPLHSHWDPAGKNLVRLSMFLLCAFLYAAWTTYNTRSYLRNVRKINQEFEASGNNSDE